MKNLAVLRTARHDTLEIAEIFADGKLSERPPLLLPIARDISMFKWVSDQALLLAWEQKGSVRLSLYMLEQAGIQHILTTRPGIAARVLAASLQPGSLEVLLAINTKQGICFGLFFPQTERYQVISDPWPRAKFGAWQPRERLLAINVATASPDAEPLQGILYRYDPHRRTQMIDLRALAGRQCVVNAFDHAQQICLTASASDGTLIPGTCSLETGASQWFREIGFSAQATGFSQDGRLVLCGGLVEADWRYAIVNRIDGGLEEHITVPDALLLDPIFCQDARYLLAWYQTPEIAPTLCRYDRLRQVCERVLDATVPGRPARIQARHWWAPGYALERLPVVSFATSSTDYSRVVLFLHGGPHLNIMKAYSPLLVRLAEQGFWVVAPNFPGSIGYGVAYEQMNRGDWGGKDVQSVIELAELLTRQVKEREGNIALYGVSYGGYLALLAAGLRPDLWSCVVAGAPVVDLEDLSIHAHGHVRDSLRLELGPLLENEAELAARSPISYVQALSRLPVLLLHGADDIVCPTRQSRRLATMLTNQGVCNFEYREFSDLKHELYAERFWDETASHFLARHSPGRCPPDAQHAPGRWSQSGQRKG
ncbi:MAG TPA: alpha/beta fold hydrolase [Ktedonobacteraceae bacterium]|jgi:pimeloyl-ACP methyl ester carboxylesterase